MRLSTTLALFGLVACSYAQSFATEDFSKVGDGTSLLDDIKGKGQSILDTMNSQGKAVLAGTTGFKMGQIPGWTPGRNPGKRELLEVAKHIAGKVGDLLTNGRNFISQLFGSTLDKLKGIASKWHQRLGLMKDTQQVDKEIDEAVTEHEEKQKRFITGLIDQGKALFEKGKELVGGLLSGLKDKASALVSGLIQKGASLLVGKRFIDLSGTLSAIGNHLSTIAAPFKDIVSEVGTTLKGHFSNLIDAVKGHAVALGDKLKDHVSTLAGHGSALLEHGKNALGAISEAVADVLKQTVDNAKPHLEGVVNTLKDGANTVVGHFVGSN